VTSFLLASILAVGSTASAVNVTLEATGTVAGNGLTSGPLAGVPVGAAVHMVFDVDSDDYTMIGPEHDWAYVIQNDTFVLTAGGAILENIINAQYIHITNDFWVVDGVHWFESNIGFGYWHEFELWGNNPDMFPSPDITECAGEYGPEEFEDTSWQINWSFFVTFELLVIHEATASADEPRAPLDPPKLTAFPNPFGNDLCLSFALPPGQLGKLMVFDASGRLVRAFAVAAPSGSVAWDGTDRVGQRVAPGTYFLSLAGKDQTATGRVTLIR